MKNYLHPVNNLITLDVTWMIFQKIITATIGMLLVLNLSAQNKRTEAVAIRKNAITKKITHVNEVNNGDATGKVYTLTIDSFNNMGFPLLKTVYKTDGTVSKKITIVYQYDTLLIGASTYNGEGQLIFSETYTYDVKDYMTYSKSSDNLSGRITETFYENDYGSHTMKNFSMYEGKKMLSGVRQYDAHQKIQTADYYDSKGAVSSSSVFEYDDVNRTMKNYRIRDGVKKLSSTSTYDNNGNIITEEHYYAGKVTITNPNGIVQEFKKGDVHKTEYSYNDKGLLIKQTDKINGDTTLQLTFEYL